MLSYFLYLLWNELQNQVHAILHVLQILINIYLMPTTLQLLKLKSSANVNYRNECTLLFLIPAADILETEFWSRMGWAIRVELMEDIRNGYNILVWKT
jgi:hypothetical protein